MARVPEIVAGAVMAAVACASAPPPAPAPQPPDATASWRTIRFGHGRGEVSLPPRYEARVNDKGGLESQTNDPRAIVHLFIDVHPLEEVGPEAATPGGCPAFLRVRARDKGLGVGEHGDKVVLIEPGIRDVVEGAVVNNVHFQICASGALFVMTLVVRESDAGRPEVKQFYADEFEPIVASLRLR